MKQPKAEETRNGDVSDASGWAAPRLSLLWRGENAGRATLQLLEPNFMCAETLCTGRLIQHILLLPLFSLVVAVASTQVTYWQMVLRQDLKVTVLKAFILHYILSLLLFLYYLYYIFYIVNSINIIYYLNYYILSLYYINIAIILSLSILVPLKLCPLFGAASWAPLSHTGFLSHKLLCVQIFMSPWKCQNFRTKLNGP